MVKENALASATEAACVILSIDETVRERGGGFGYAANIFLHEK